MTHIVEKKKNAEEGAPPMAPPPDGGWGWVVVFASFMIHIVNDGITYSFGVFYVNFLEYFKEGNGKTALIVSILVGVTLCSGPISSVFVNWYGCRRVSICGAALAGFCIIVSVFAQNVVTLCITIGVGAGVGFGLIYLPAIVCVTVYFEKYRSLATGIAVCGSGVGTIIFAPLTEFLISYYGWRGAMLLMGGIVLNCIFFGALFRPVETVVTDNYIEPATEMQLLKTEDVTNNDKNIIKSVTANGDSFPRSQSIGQMRYTLVQGNGNKPNGQPKTNDKLNPNNHETARLALSQPMLNTSLDDSKRSQSLKRVESGIMYKPDILYQGSLLNLSQRRRGSAFIDERNHVGRYGSRMSVKSQVAPPTGIPTTEDFQNTIATLIDFKLFFDPIFIVFTISNFLTSIGFYIPYVYIVAQAEVLKIPKDMSSYLLSIIGIANTIGRIILGYLADKPWINRLLVYNTSLTLCGIATMMSVICTDFYTLGIYASVFGFTIGAYVGLTSVILVDLLGLERLTDAFGILLLFQGIASVVGSPLAGVLYDQLGSYDPGFYVAGATIAVSGVMLFCIPYIQRWQFRKERKAELYDDGEGM